MSCRAFTSDVEEPTLRALRENLDQGAGEPGAFEPILYEEADGRMLAADWAEGFMDAFGCRHSGNGAGRRPSMRRRISADGAAWNADLRHLESDVGSVSDDPGTDLHWLLS